VWLKSRQFGFVVLAGQLERPDGGIVGGLADTWSAALQLFRLTADRLDEAAEERSQPFTSRWYLYLNPERQAQMAHVLPDALLVGGEA
jgi:hypothetical protein